MAFQYIHFIVSLLVLILVGFVGFAVKNLKGITATLKNAFDSMETSVQYVKAVQEIGKSLYDPNEIEKLVRIRIEVATSEIRAAAKENIVLYQKETLKTLRHEVDQLKNELQSDFDPLAMFVFVATTFLSPDYLDYTIRTASKKGNPELLEKIVQNARQAFAKEGYTLPVKIKGIR